MAKKLAPEKAGKYRYRLLELAYKASDTPSCGKLSVDEQAKLLEAEYGISQPTFFRDRYLTHTSTQIIPETRMQAYARFYNVPEGDIRNTRPEQKRTLAELVYGMERRNHGLLLPVDTLQPLAA